MANGGSHGPKKPQPKGGGKQGSTTASKPTEAKKK